MKSIIPVFALVGFIVGCSGGNWLNNLTTGSNPAVADPAVEEQRMRDFSCRIGNEWGLPIKLNPQLITKASAKMGEKDASDLIRPTVSATHAYNCSCDAEYRRTKCPQVPGKGAPVANRVQ